MKKILALTLSLLLAVLLLPTAALAEENNVARNETTGTEYVSLKDAIGAATNGDTITLLKDCNLSNGYNVVQVLNPITLDLKGFTMTLENSFCVQNHAAVTIQNNETTGGIVVKNGAAFSTANKTKLNLTGLTITGQNAQNELFDVGAGSAYMIENCDITWNDICMSSWGIGSRSITIKDTKMELTGSKDGFILNSTNENLEIINSTITGEAAKLFITPDTNNPVVRPSVSIASDAPQNGTIEYSYGAYKIEYDSGRFILPGVSDAATKLKALLADSFRSATLLVPGPDGLYLSNSALEYLGDAKNGETYTIEQAGPQEQMEELAKPGAVPANGCIIVNGTDAAITVNEVVIQPGESHTFTEKGPEIDPPETNITVRLPEEEPAPANPTTGAVTVAVCVARTAVAVLG